MIPRDIRTDRLRLRPLMEADLPWICKAAGDFEVSKWLVPVPHPYTMADAQDFLAMDREGALGTLWVIDHAEVSAGVISIGKELGYWLGRAHWGQGIMTEAGRAAVTAHFSHSDDLEILSSHFDDNYGSRRVLEKLGFVDVSGVVHVSAARQAKVPGRSMRLARERWETLATHS